MLIVNFLGGLLVEGQKLVIREERWCKWEEPEY